MNRGSPARGSVPADRVRASMRPRFMNRGSVCPAHRSRRSGSRFNEAPIHESGKCPDDARAARNRNGFNEAPIHESGKSHTGSWTRSWSMRFNEAPIHESGKSRATQSRVRPDPASMRPRFMNRGSTWPSCRTIPRLTGFNEAPIHESGKSCVLPASVSLQCCFNEAPIHESGKSSMLRSDLPGAVELQ